MSSHTTEITYVELPSGPVLLPVAHVQPPGRSLHSGGLTLTALTTSNANKTFSINEAIANTALNILTRQKSFPLQYRKFLLWKIDAVWSFFCLWTASIDACKEVIHSQRQIILYKACTELSVNTVQMQMNKFSLQNMIFPTLQLVYQDERMLFPWHVNLSHSWENTPVLFGSHWLWPLSKRWSQWTKLSSTYSEGLLSIIHQ